MTRGHTAPSTSIAGRPHFEVHRENASVGRYIALPMLSKRTGEWSIYISRRLNQLNEQFGGVAIAAISPDRISSLYESAAATRPFLITMIDQEGGVYAANRHSNLLLGQTIDIQDTLAPTTKAISHLPVARLWNNDDGVIKSTSLRSLPFRLVIAYPLKELQVELAPEYDLYRQLAVYACFAAAILCTLISFNRYFRAVLKYSTTSG